MSTTRTRRTRKAPTTPTKAKPAATTEAKTKTKATAVPANCGCGCGQPTITSKATFLAGHDARHAGNLGRALAADPTNADLLTAYGSLSNRLKGKVDAIRLTATKKAATKDARAVAEAAAKQAYADAMAAAGVTV